MGVMERVRLEHVLREAGVPTDDEEFVAYVDEDPPRLRRLVSATLAKSAAEWELVAGGYARWTAGLSRGVIRPRAPTGGASPSMGVGSPMVTESPRRSSGLRWIGPLMMLGAMALGMVWVLRLPGDDGNHHGAEGATGEVDTDGGPRIEDNPDSTGLGADTSESAPQPSFGRGEPVDLRGVDVAVPWPVMVAVPRAWVEPPSSPWQSWVVGTISLLVFGLTWWRTRRRSLLPQAAVRSPLPGAGRVQPQLDRGDVPAFVERSEQETLIWGIGREVSDRPTDRLDAERTIDATIARGGLPELWFQPALEHRGVWLWRDRRMKTGQADAKRLQAEIVETLTAAALPVHVATFARVPEQLQKVDGPTFSPHELDEQRRTARVVVLTDGHGLLRARTARAQVGVQDLLQRFAGWHALAVVVFGEHGDEVERMLAPYGIPCLQPADAVAHLAGALHGGSQVERERELLRWEAACAMAPLRIREADALALRTALELNIEGFAVDALRRRFGRGQHLVWSAAQRAAILADYDRAFGYRAMGWDAVGEKSLTGRALAFWREYYALALEGAGLDARTREHLEIEQLVLGLWDRPEEVVRGQDGRDGLFALFQTEEFEAVVRGLVSQYTDVDGSAQRVRLPWRYDERPADVQVMLGRMGFAVEDVASDVERAGRWGWGLGLALGVGVAALSHGVMETMMPVERGGEPTIEWVGQQPTVRSGFCYQLASREQPGCEVISRLSSGRFDDVGEDRVVVASWVVTKTPCVMEWVVEGVEQRWSWCTSTGRLVEGPRGRALSSIVVVKAEIDDQGAHRLVRLLLDTGSADLVVTTPSSAAPHNPLLSVWSPDFHPSVSGQRLWLARDRADTSYSATSTAIALRSPEADWDVLSEALFEASGLVPIENVWTDLEVRGSFSLVGGNGHRVSVEPELDEPAPAEGQESRRGGQEPSGRSERSPASTAPSPRGGKRGEADRKPKTLGDRDELEEPSR